MKAHLCARCGALNRISSAPAGALPVCGKCKADLDVSGEPRAVNSAQLDSAVRNSPVPVLVDFWAPWCGPCRTAAPIFAEVGRRKAGDVLVLKVNSDDEQDASARLGIRAIPTFVLFHGGQEIARHSGVMPAADLDRWVSGHVRT